jgi:cytochrome c biogenesis protein CcmG/thiol:disulfide interchange protein DsbE
MHALLFALLLGDPLPTLDLAALDGKPVALAATGRVRVIDLFATWCGPCRESLPVLERLRQRFPYVEFVSIDSDEDAATVERFARAMKLGGRVLVGRGAYKALGAHTLPTTVIVDDKGVVRHINHGFGRGYEARMTRWLDELQTL